MYFTDRCEIAVAFTVVALMRALPLASAAGYLFFAFTGLAGVLAITFAGFAFHLTRPKTEQSRAFTAANMAAPATIIARDCIGGVKVIMSLRVRHGPAAVAFRALAFPASATGGALGFPLPSAFIALVGAMGLTV